MAVPSPTFKLLALACTCFLLLITPTRAMWDWLPPAQMCDSAHNYQPQSYSGPAPPLPDLPNQYKMTVSANILQKNWNSEVTEYYDGPNKRASVFLTFNGTTTRTIFNLKKMEKYDIYPNNTCRTRPGSVDFYGFISMDRKHRPVMSTVNEMFRMGGKFNMTYVGQTWVRGIRVNHWTSCQEWQQIGSKFQLDWYFTHPDYQGAWGQGQLPVRAVVNGSAGNVNMNHGHMKGRHRFEHIYDFTMKVGPIEDKEVFYIPPEVMCSGRTDNRAMPDIPDNFQMDMEVSCPIQGSSIPMQQTLRYDWEHRLVETWRAFPHPQGRPEDLHKQLMNGQTTAEELMNVEKMVMKTVSMVDDYSTGLRYFTEKSNNTCKVVQLPANEDETSMSHGSTLLNIKKGQHAGDSPFTYQGRSKYRNLPVQVWGVERDGMVQKLLFLAKQGPAMMKPRSRTTRAPPKSLSKRAVFLHSGDTQRPQQGNGKSDSGRPVPTLFGANTGQAGGSVGSGNGRPKPTGTHKPWSPLSGSNRPRPTGSSGNWGGANNRPRPTSSSGRKWWPTKGNNKPWPTRQPSGNSNWGQSGVQSMISKSMAKMSNMSRPFPVLVGMVFRNYTAINTRNMPKLFREIITSEVIQWAQENYNKETAARQQQQQQGGAAGHSDKDLDQMLSMERIHSKMMKHMGEMDVNVFHFQPLHTDASMFQVSQCYSPEETSQVKLHVHTPYQNVHHNRDAFSIAMRKGVAEAMGVSFLQISDLNPAPLVDKKNNVDKTSVTFTLLGSPPAHGNRKKQPSIGEAKEKLSQAIKNGISFKVKYATHTKSFLVEKSPYSVDDILNTPQGRSQDSFVRFDSQQGNEHNDGDDSSEKYNAGAVAGIAIATLALGAICATVAVAFLYKRRHPEEPVVPYKISKT